MTEKELQGLLKTGRISKEKRDNLVSVLLTHPELTGTLLELVIEEDATNTWHCSWVFDHLMRKNILFLLPYLDRFCSQLSFFTSESVLRPVAHTCELLLLGYFKTKNPSIQKALTNTHLKQLAEACFDWLIGSHKVACKVFAMSCLFYLGEQQEWIRPELKSTLENQIANSSKGFKSRGTKILENLKNLGY